MFCRSKNLKPYKVKVHINGRHPYLKSNELDYETRDVELTVPAKNWNGAADVALRTSMRLAGWSFRVTSIEAVE